MKSSQLKWDDFILAKYASSGYTWRMDATRVDPVAQSMSGKRPSIPESGMDSEDIDRVDQIMTDEPANVPAPTITIRVSYRLYREQRSKDPSLASFNYLVSPQAPIPEWNGTISGTGTSFSKFKTLLFQHVTTRPKIHRLLEMADCVGQLHVYCANDGRAPLGFSCWSHGIHYCTYAAFVEATLAKPNRTMIMMLSMSQFGTMGVGTGTEFEQLFSEGNFFALSESGCPARSHKFYRREGPGFRLRANLRPHHIKPEIQELISLEEMLEFCGIPEDDGLTHGLIDIHRLYNWETFWYATREQLVDLGFGLRAIELIKDGLPLYLSHLNDCLFDTSDEEEFYKYDNNLYHPSM
ncbi:hypothetical protein PTTG_29805 [Puccinia triticina 1-1 BBBD Race 1]|uniref:Uncharacterized protein n=1 Tax=Puccinia triticina (isolate 1-1 / race 1 (BBBD)) TaxID=630390 RepID=A0A180G1U7_PUCT1|nr:hypothetical protein PTTG_29805 [Puccinia triticina 1-1 BBBD Race 1]